MPDSAAAGVFGMLPEATDCAQMRQQAPPQVLPVCGVKAQERKEA